MKALTETRRRSRLAASGVAGRVVVLTLAALLCWPVIGTTSDSLEALKERGVLRHLGIPYANFVTGAGDGMDVELMQGFADWLGVDYEYVRTDWSSAIGNLTGKKVRANGDDVEVLGNVPVTGDVIANGMTVIPWRKKVVAFAEPTFPTQVWLMSRADSPAAPIRPSNSLVDDIVKTKSVLDGKTLLGKLDTCLDPSLYDMEKTGAEIALFDGTLNELAPALLANESEFTLLDVPDALVALQKWPGEIKVIGPVSERQDMAPAFRPEDRALRDAFNTYLAAIKADGRFDRLARKYYPFVVDYFPDFIAAKD
ncbi:ABC transporter substrate-binding protein [Thiohalocapsa halophila]|uniref:ABC transporter substrate-binding protein n=1 Tax=Thiohalocapsa halophila TaxID=69359 RepID=A0ABS1CN43_9GAMM|nr:transporter substrate-binding domain-containing protein [Thiohalocapsa halophila]MBK1633363.1 ABC transporter substrate-binding protein [Thiohalocapsa halophila]